MPGLDETQFLRLSEAGIDTADRLIEVETAVLAEVAGVDEATARILQTTVREQIDAAERAAGTADDMPDASMVQPAGTPPVAPPAAPDKTPTAE